MGNMMEATERYFSVELKSRSDLKSVVLANGARYSVLIEGTIGGLVRAAFVEGILLEIVGEKGTLRINLGEEDVRKATTKDPEDVK